MNLVFFVLCFFVVFIAFILHEVIKKYSTAERDDQTKYYLSFTLKLNEDPQGLM